MLRELAIAGAVGLNPVSGGDTPIEPITSDTMALGINAGLAVEACEAYDALVPVFVVWLDGDLELARDVVDAFTVAMLEEGYGPSARLTVEAEELMLDYFHDGVCL